MAATIDPVRINAPVVVVSDVVAVSVPAPPELLCLFGGLLGVAELPLLQSLLFISQRLYLCMACTRPLSGRKHCIRVSATLH